MHGIFLALYRLLYERIARPLIFREHAAAGTRAHDASAGVARRSSPGRISCSDGRTTSPSSSARSMSAAFACRTR